MSEPSRPDPDPVMVTLDLLADRWTFLVLREAFFGVRRYGMFQRNLGIGRNTLANRLTRLVDHGILTKVRYRRDPDWFEYQLAESGMALMAPVLALRVWAEKHLLGHEQPVVRVRHSCGAELQPLIVCACCGKPFDGTDIEVDNPA